MSLEVPRENPYSFYSTYFVGVYDRIELGAGDVVIDAGAQFGDFTIKASRSVGATGSVFAIEPDPEAMAYLRRNIERLGITNVHVVPTSLRSGEKGAIGIGSPRTEASSGLSLTAGGMTIDQLVERLAIKHVDVLKVDIEGPELEVLADFQGIRAIREIAVETHSVDTRIRLSNFLRSIGFQVRRIDLPTVCAFSMRNVLLHLPSYVSSEQMSGFLGLRTIIDAVKGKPPVAGADKHGALSILYARQGSSTRLSA